MEHRWASYSNMARSLHDIYCNIYHNFSAGKYSKKIQNWGEKLFFFEMSHVQGVFAFTNEAFEFILFSSGLKIDAISTWAQPWVQLSRLWGIQDRNILHCCLNIQNLNEQFRQQYPKNIHVLLVEGFFENVLKPLSPPKILALFLYFHL